MENISIPFISPLPSPPQIVRTFYDSGVIVDLTLQIFLRRPLTKYYKESANTKQYNTEKYILLAGFEPAMPGLDRQKNIFETLFNVFPQPLVEGNLENFNY